MPTASLPSPYKFAGFWIRFLALILDWVVLGIIGYVVFGSEVTQISSSGPSVSVNFEGWRVLVPIAYYLIFWIWLSATPGKLICGLKIIETNGQKLSWQKAIVRFIAYILSAVALLLGFIWAAFDKNKQGWHDKIAKTYVIRK